MKKGILLILTVALVQLINGAAVDNALALTNKLRAAHGASPLSISSTLTQYAQNYANQLAAKDTFEHSESPYGENLYMTYDPVTGNDAIQHWYDEKHVYNFNSPTFDTATGHFTQLVWKGSKTVGFGISKKSASGAYYVVAEYDPPGNIEGRFAANVGRG